MVGHDRDPRLDARIAECAAQWIRACFYVVVVVIHSTATSITTTNSKSLVDEAVSLHTTDSQSPRMQAAPSWAARPFYSLPLLPDTFPRDTRKRIFAALLQRAVKSLRISFEVADTNQCQGKLTQRAGLE